MGQTNWTDAGGYLANAPLSKEMRNQARPDYIWRQFAKVNMGLGAKKGSSIDFTKKLKIDTRGGTLIETTTMPSNEIKFVTDSITVTEYGNAVECTEKVLTLSQFTLDDELNASLVEDQVDTIDATIGAVFKEAEFIAVCSATNTTEFTTDGVATVTATVNPSDKNIRKIVQYMKKANIPMLGKYYIGMFSVEALGGVYDYLQAIAQYAEPSFRLNSEIGRYYDVRFIEENSVLSNVVGSTSLLGEAIMFGEDAVAEAVALPEELRYDVDDMGRSHKYAWYGILGWKKVWSLASDDTNSTGKGLERIVYITSA